jgi:hypothetical protein
VTGGIVYSALSIRKEINSHVIIMEESPTYKIVTYTVRKKLESIAEEVTWEYYAGFQEEGSTMDHIFPMKQISEKCSELISDIHRFLTGLLLCNQVQS